MNPQANDLRSVLAGLPAKWRAGAINGGGHMGHVRSAAMRECADQLEAALLHGGGGDDLDGDESGSPVWRSAPKELWLQIDTDGDDYSQPFPDPGHDVSWCAESMGGVEVRYVRDDLTTPPPQPRGDMVLPSDTGPFADWLAREMPPGTVISSPAWWTRRILRQIAMLAAAPGEGSGA